MPAFGESGEQFWSVSRLRMGNAVSMYYHREPRGCGVGCRPTGGEANYLVTTAEQGSCVNTLEAARGQVPLGPGGVLPHHPDALTLKPAGFAPSHLLPASWGLIINLMATRVVYLPPKPSQQKDCH